MHLDVNILIILMLNIGLALAMARYGPQLFNYGRPSGVVQTIPGNSLSNLRVDFGVSRPVKRYYFPRIKVKSDSNGDEPPHTPL